MYHSWILEDLLLRKRKRKEEKKEKRRKRKKEKIKVKKWKGKFTTHCPPVVERSTPTQRMTQEKYAKNACAVADTKAKTQGQKRSYNVSQLHIFSEKSPIDSKSGREHMLNRAYARTHLRESVKENKIYVE